MAEALKLFYEIREVPGMKKKPSTSELLDWLKLLMVEDIGPEMLRERDPKKLIPPLHGALLKNEQDVHLFERLAFMAAARPLTSLRLLHLLSARFHGGRGEVLTQPPNRAIGARSSRAAPSGCGSSRLLFRVGHVRARPIAAAALVVPRPRRSRAGIRVGVRDDRPRLRLRRRSGGASGAPAQRRTGSAGRSTSAGSAGS